MVNCHSFKKKSLKIFKNLSFSHFSNLVFTSDQRYIIFAKKESFFIYDSLNCNIIFRLSSINSKRICLNPNFLFLNSTSQNLYLINKNDNCFDLCLLCLEYLKVFKQKTQSTQTLRKRYFTKDEISFFKYDPRKQKPSQQELNDHIKKVFQNLGFEDRSLQRGETHFACWC